MNIWFTSDTHFFHQNIIKFCRYSRFQTLEEMHDTLVQNWNRVVKPGDTVYHLGDVTFKQHDDFFRLWRQLNGSKRLIVENHDDLTPKFVGQFHKVQLWTGGKFKEHNFVCSHIPLREDQMRDAEFNVHGHIHEKTSPSPRHINVCVEQTEYTPVSLDELASLCKA